MKEQARAKVAMAIKKGLITVPLHCEECNQIPREFKDNRRPLRADHFLGYEHSLSVRFICVDCDGLQLRSRESVVI